MDLKTRFLAVLLASGFGAAGCHYASGEADRTGETVQPPTAPAEVIIYLKAPAGYAEVGTVSSESAISTTVHGGSLHYAAVELKKQAARIGANGLINVDAFLVRSDPVGSPTDAVKDIRLTATAILVPASAPVDDSAVLMSKLPGLHPPAWSAPGPNGAMRLVAKGPQDLAPDVPPGPP